MLSERYDEEQEELREKASRLQISIDEQEEKADNLDKFIDTAKRYCELTGLDGYILHELIKGIYIENADVPNESTETETDIDDDGGEYITVEKKPKASSTKIHRIRKIHIKYDFVGFIPINELNKFAKETLKSLKSEKSA